MEYLVKIPRPHEGQIEILQQAARYNVLECGRRFGKTKLGEILTAKAACLPAPVGWFAPTYKFLKEAWRDIVKMLGPVIARADQQEGRIELIHGGAIDFWSIDKADAGRGRKYIRVIVDEAGIVRNLEEAWNEAIRPTLTDLRGDAWFLGTPKGRNFFHQLYAKGESSEPGWASWRRGTVHNPMIDPAEIEEARRQMPEAAFNQEYLGIPADDGGNPFGIDSIRACIKPAQSTERPRAFGWDLAKSVDWTVGVGLDKSGHMAAFERFQKPWGETETIVLRTTGPCGALVDSTGVGDPIVERMQTKASNFEGFKFTSQSKQQLMEGLAAALQQRLIGIVDGPVVSELESFQYEYTPTGVRYEAPPGQHDDCVMALALAWRKLSHGTAPMIAPQGSTQTSYWRF